MKREFWDEIKEIGKLYVEEELVVGIEPVLQVCVDEPGYNRYLVMTYDSGKGKYVLCRIDSRVLVDMLENKRTMEETFRAAGRIYMTHALTDDLLQAAAYEADEFPADMLPDKGAYYDISSEYVQRYVERLKNSQDIVKIVIDKCKTIQEIRMSLSASGPKSGIRNDSKFFMGKEYKADHIDMDNNRYSIDSSKYFAA